MVLPQVFWEQRGMMHLWAWTGEDLQSLKTSCFLICLHRLKAKSKAPSCCAAGMRDGVGGTVLKFRL